MRMGVFSVFPLVFLTAACSQMQSPQARRDLDSQRVARQKITTLFADHCDRFTCDSFTYANHTIHATGIHIAPDPSITQDHPSATLAVKDLRIVLAEDPTPAADLRPVEIDIDEPTLRRPDALRASTDPTPVEAALSTFIINTLDQMSTPEWTKLFDLTPDLAAPPPEARAACEREFGALQRVNVHLLRIEMPPDQEGAPPDALVLSADITKGDDGEWSAAISAGQQTGNTVAQLAPPMHVLFAVDGPRLMARSPDISWDADTATALER
ncbi:MAG TPA: hypothetical protein VH253_20355 [Phycisphaerae bacterium]|nr:hypothetical protein [Phycisphaerae bacterium]